MKDIAVSETVKNRIERNQKRVHELDIDVYKRQEPTEPENPEPEKKSNTGAILAVLLILAAGGGAAVYFLVLKPKQGRCV